MVKKTKKQEFNYPEVKNWIPYQPFSKNKEEIFTKSDHTNDLVDVPDNWKEPEFTPSDNPHKRLFALSSFHTLFPSYREKYLNEIWPAHVKAEIDLAESKMTVSTTPKTYDPYIIIKSRDMIKMLARSVPFEQAKRILDNDVFGEIIEIKLINKARFIKRRNRLIGEDGETLKAIELATGCYVLVQGKTVSAIGNHSAYAIKRLIIQRKLASDPSKKDSSWDKFLPKIKKKSLSKRKKPHKIRKKKEYNPFPPAIEKSKVDIALEKGYYFLSQEEKKDMDKSSKIASSKEKSRKRQVDKRTLPLLPPDERKKFKKSLKDN